MKKIFIFIMFIFTFIYISNVEATYVADKTHSVFKKGEIIYFDATGLDWEHVYVHIWEKNGLPYKEWSSNDEMTKVEGTNNMYMFTLPNDIDEKYNMIIFHNENSGNNNQTIDLGHIEENYAYKVTGLSDEKRIGYWYLYDKSNLQTHLNNLKQYQDDKEYYTAPSYDNLDTLITNIETSLNGEIRLEQDTTDLSKYYIAVDYTFEEADDIVSSLIVNKDLLSNIITEEEDKYEDYEKVYTKKSLDNLKGIIDDKKELLTGSITVDDIKNGIDDINEAKNGLINQADKTNLKKIIEEITNLEKDKYTEESYEELENLLKSADEILQDTNQKQDEVDKYVEKLKNAIKELKEKDNNSEVAVPKTLDDIVKIFGILGISIAILVIIVIAIKKMKKS